MAADLASTIAGARRAAGLTQAALARRAGISASYLSRIEGAAWERGGPWPADGVLRALARALGLSSTELIALRREAQAARQPVRDAGGLARANGRTPYAVSVGARDVDAAACGVIERNPGTGTLRLVQVLAGRGRGRAPSFVDGLGPVMATRPRSLLYRVIAGGCESTDGARRPGNVRSRTPRSNPLVLDVLVGDHEVFLAFPDRRGHPYLRAGIGVDDPDFVAAARGWFDESVWDPPSGAEEHLDPAGALVVGPGADADARELGREDVAPVGR